MELDFNDDALELVAKKSLERKTGARGLRAIMEGSLMDLMYKIPSDETIRKCVITKDAEKLLHRRRQPEAEERPGNTQKTNRKQPDERD